MGAPPGEPYFAEEPPEENVKSLPWSAIYRNALVDHIGLQEIPEPVPLITGMLYTDSIAWIAGKSGDGKSFITLDMAGCVGTGTPWQDHSVMQGLVLYVVAEGASGMKQRVRAWEESYGRPMTGVRWLPLAPQTAHPAQWIGLTDLAREMRPALVVLDTQARITVGLEENAAKDMGEFVDQLEKLRQVTGACVLIVHHQGRVGGHMRGSTAMEGAATTTIQVVKDGPLITLANEKQKDAAPFDPFTLKLTPLGKSAVLTLQSEGLRSSLEAALPTAAKWWGSFRGDKVSASALEKAEVAPKSTLHRHITMLVENGVAVKEPANASETRFMYRLLNDPAETSHGPNPVSPPTHT